jgi:hypothetical protein
MIFDLANGHYANKDIPAQASPFEFWSALKIAESAKDDCSEALKAVDLHIIKHQCQPIDGP